MGLRLVAGCVLVGIAAGACGQTPADPDAVSKRLAGQEAETRALLMAHATELSGADAAYRAEEFAPLLQWVRGKRLVMVSEPTHAMHECRAENAKLVRFLVERDGVQTVVLEVGYAAGRELDGYVRRGDGEVDRMVASDLGVIWNTVEEADMLRWIAGWNRAHPAEMVRVAGMDIDATGAGGMALVGLLRGLGLDAGLVERVRVGAEAAKAMKGPAKATATAEERAASAAYDAALAELVLALEGSAAGGQGVGRMVALRSAMSVRSGRMSTELRAGGPDGNDAGQRLREFAMARAALAFLGDSAAPAVIVTHTIHLRPGRLEGDRVQSLGFHLARVMGDRVFFLGEEYGTGSMRAMVPAAVGVTGPRPMHAAEIDPPMPGSLAAALGDQGPLLVDMRDPRDGSAWSEWLESLQATHLYLAITYAAGQAALPNWTVPADAFDGLVYLPKVTALHPIGASEYVP